MKEIRNKNALLFKTGDELWKLLNEARKMVGEVKFWEVEK
jgi:hypothetical protein